MIGPTYYCTYVHPMCIMSQQIHWSKCTGDVSMVIGNTWTIEGSSPILDKLSFFFPGKITKFSLSNLYHGIVCLKCATKTYLQYVYHYRATKPQVHGHFTALSLKFNIQTVFRTYWYVTKTHMSIKYFQYLHF